MPFWKYTQFFRCFIKFLVSYCDRIGHMGSGRAYILQWRNRSGSCAFVSMWQSEIEKYERCRVRNGRWEEIAVYKAAFLVLVIMFLIYIWGNMGRVIMNAVIRCLFCLICVYLCNGLIQYFGGNIAVKINEITVCVSTLLGISGVAGLYVLQLFFTIHG